MCGRFTLTVTQETLNQYLYEVFDLPYTKAVSHQPRYNIAPSQEVLAVIHDGEKYRVGKLKWGFVAGQGKKQSKPFSVINIRQESLTTKPMFQQAYRSKRCLILADGFYEWHQEQSKKQAYHITLPKQPIFAFAGLWNSYLDSANEKQYTCAIITTESVESIATIHHRMPIILDRSNHADWLRPLEISAEQVLSAAQSDFSLMKVSNYVNAVSHDDKACIVPLSP